MVNASRRRVILGDPEEHKAKRKLVELKEVEARRRLRADADEPALTHAPKSEFKDVLEPGERRPEWLITEDFVDEVLGTIKSGKEGNVVLVERSSPERSHLLALKKYKNPVTRSFHRDQMYREGRKFFHVRDQKAVERGTQYGRKLMSEQWHGAESIYLERLWQVGAQVPYPVEGGPGQVLMEFLGDETRAAPRLVDARLSRPAAESALDQILGQVRLMAAEGVVHADLSAFNVLWWQNTAYIIDLPQSVEIAINPHWIELLERDLANILRWFGKFGIERDFGEELALVLGAAYR